MNECSNSYRSARVPGNLGRGELGIISLTFVFLSLYPLLASQTFYASMMTTTFTFSSVFVPFNLTFPLAVTTKWSFSLTNRL